MPFRPALITVALAALIPAAMPAADPRAPAQSTPAVRPDIVGTVTGPDGQPLAGATVFVDIAWPKVGRGVICPSCYIDCRKSATTDATGAFRIPSLDPALAFRLLATAPNAAPTFVNIDNPGAVSVALRLAAVKGGETPDKRAAVRVLDPQGAPVGGAIVSVSGICRGDLIHSVRGDQISYQLATTPDGHTLLRGDRAFDALQIKVRAHGFAQAAAVVAAGDTPTEVRLESGVTVTGRLVRDGKPVPDQPVAIVPKDRDTKTFFHPEPIRTDAEGRFTLAPVAAHADYLVYAIAEAIGAVGTTVPREIRAGDNGGTRDIGDLAIVRGHTLAGRVEIDGGKPLPAHTRLMISRDDAWDQFILELPASGEFRIPHVAPGPVRVAINLTGYHPAPGVSVDARRSLAGMVVGDKTDLRLAFTSVKPASNPSETAVQRESRRPLAGAEASGKSLPPPPSAEVVAAARAAQAADRAAREKEIQAHPTWRVTSRVLTATGQPVPGALVRRIDTAGNPFAETRIGSTRITDADGRFDFGTSATGDWFLVEVSAPGYRLADTDGWAGTGIMPFSQQDAAITVTTAPKPQGKPWSLRVTDAFGRPVRAAVARLCGVTRHAQWKPVPQCLAHSDGDGLVTLRYEGAADSGDILVAAPGYAPQLLLQRAAGEEPQTVSLTRGATVTGRLLQAGKPLAHAPLVLRGAWSARLNYYDDRAEPHVRTDADGRFRFELLPAESRLRLHLELHHESVNALLVPVDVSAPASGKTLDLGDLNTEAGVRVAGEIRRTNGTAGEATVVMQYDNGLWLSTRSDVAGRFEFPHAFPGVVRLSVHCGGPWHLTENNAVKSNGIELRGRVLREKTDLVIEIAPGMPTPASDSDSPGLEPLHGIETTVAK